MSDIILASGSPRRKEILEKLGLDIEVIKPEIEEIIWEGDKPSQLVMGLSFQKALNVAKKREDKIVLAADTIVVLEEEILGKPRDSRDAFDMLSNLSGKTHRVLTGYSIVNLEKNIKLVNYSETKVEFKMLSEDFIKSYIGTGEPMDKAGAYGIQGYGQLLVEGIVGSYSNVVGLPVEKISTDLDENFNIKII